MTTTGVTACELWCLLREQSPKAALADIRDILRSRFYMKTDQIVLRKELAAAEPTAARTIRMEEAGPQHVPLLAEFNRRQYNSANVPARWLYTTNGHEVVLRCNTGTLLRRLVLIDGRGWLLAGRAACDG